MSDDIHQILPSLCGLIVFNSVSCDFFPRCSIILVNSHRTTDLVAHFTEKGKNVQDLTS